MSRARVVGSLVLALFVVALLGLAIWWGLTQLQREVAAALVTALGAVIVVLISRYYEQRRTAEANIRVKKAAIYEDFISFWIELLMFKDEAKTNAETAELLSALSAFTKGVLIYGSDNVVLRWSRYRQRFFQGEEQIAPELDPLVLLDFETVLLGIRQEFGHKNQGLQRGDLLGLFVNNVQLLVQAERDRNATPDA